MKKRKFISGSICSLVTTKCYSQDEPSNPWRYVSETRLKLRSIKAMRIIHDLEFREEIYSIELMVRCVIAATNPNTLIRDGFNLQTNKDSFEVRGKPIKWDEKFRDASAELVYQAVADANTWMLSFEENCVTIHRGVV